MLKTFKKVVIASIMLSLSLTGSVGATTDSTGTAGTVDSITITSDGANITWKTNGYSGKGFKVVWSLKSGPTYPLRSTDKYHYFTDPYKNTDTLTAFNGNGTYYARVCEYLGGECGVYSNEVTVSIGEVDASETDVANVNGITLKGGDKNISWTIDGYSDQGFKVVWSKNKNPIYPNRTGDKYHYYNDPYKSSDEITAFDGLGTYYVRVCEYVSGKCGVYSNEIVVGLSSESDSTTEGVNAISLKGEGDSISWVVDGYSKSGYKVVWSKHSSPTYPSREVDRYHYYNDPYKSQDNINAFSGDGSYYVRVCEYLGGKCGKYSNEIKVYIVSEIICTLEYAPVCGVNGKTYQNSCVAKNQKGIEVAYKAACEKGAEIVAMEEKADLLYKNKLETILSEINLLRDVIREQNNEIKYLKSLMGDLTALTAGMQTSINNFITYGVDDNTKRLGEGERAAVIHSYKSAYGSLPESEEDLADAIKIANGRWPTKTSQEAETKAHEQFQKIYKRSADMSSPRDDAAVTIMSYGLRQKAQNRNLNSERTGIEIFKGIYGHNPSNTEEWNIMQAITYSGASR